MIWTVALGALLGTLGHSGQSAIFGLSQRSAIIRVAAGRTGELTEARSQAEAALAAYMCGPHELPGAIAGMSERELSRQYWEPFDRLAYPAMV